MTAGKVCIWAWSTEGVDIIVYRETPFLEKLTQMLRGELFLVQSIYYALFCIS